MLLLGATSHGIWNETVGLLFTFGVLLPALATMMQRVLTDDALRDRLVAEAGAHVLRFDWADVAEQTAQVYGALAQPGAARRVTRRPA